MRWSVLPPVSPSVSSIQFDSDGTMRCILQFGDLRALYLARVRSDGTVLPIMQLPFELPTDEFGVVYSNIGDFIGNVSFAGRRGYTSLGWETADGGEHWTRVDAYADAKRVQCITSGCLVDGARRIGWALPESWRGGMASKEVTAVTSKARSLSENGDKYECSATGPGIPFEALAHCRPARTDIVKWATLAGTKTGQVDVQLFLANGQLSSVTLLEPNDAPLDAYCANGMFKRAPH